MQKLSELTTYPILPSSGLVATPGRALAECLALRRTVSVVLDLREPWGRIERILLYP